MLAARRYAIYTLVLSLSLWSGISTQQWSADTDWFYAYWTSAVYEVLYSIALSL
jgi:hypothetical protein